MTVINTPIDKGIAEGLQVGDRILISPQDMPSHRGRRAVQVWHRPARCSHIPHCCQSGRGRSYVQQQTGDRAEFRTSFPGRCKAAFGERQDC